MIVRSRFLPATALAAGLACAWAAQAQTDVPRADAPAQAALAAPSPPQEAGPPSAAADPAPAVKPQPAPDTLLEAGIASYYASEMEGNRTASGEPYRADALTAAHRTLPLGSLVRVTSPATRKSVVVRVNDRWGGGGRVINLSRRAADELGFDRAMELRVELVVEELGSGSSAPAALANANARMPELVDEATSSRQQQCANQGRILGLRDQYLKNHMANCLKRR